MTDSIEADFSELDQLSASFDQVAATAGPFINSAIQHTSREVKKSAAKKVSSSKYWKAAAQAIGYDIAVFLGFGVSVIKSEIGYDKEKTAGALGNLREFGAPDSPHGALSPHSDLVIALGENTGDFVKGLDIALKDAERKAGL